MAVELLFNAINTYAYPLMEAAGLRVDPYGYITDQNGKKVCFVNQRYNKNNDNGESPVFYPVIPTKDTDYLDIKESVDKEIFNPFSNIKHMIMIAVKMKKLAIVDLNKDLLATAMDEDDYDKFDEMVGLSNDINAMGQIDYALIDMSLNTKPELLRYPCGQDEPIKGLWALCVMMYNRYITQRPPYLKIFQDIDKSWKKICSAMNKWDKEKKTIIRDIKKEENSNINLEYMDLSEGIAPGTPINPYDKIKTTFTSDDFIDVGEDVNSVALQNYLTNMFPKSQLTPVIEETDIEDDVGTIATDITNEEPSFDNMKFVNESMEVPEEMKSPEIQLEETGNTIEIEKPEYSIETVDEKEPLEEPKKIVVEKAVEVTKVNDEPAKVNTMFKVSADDKVIHQSGNLNMNNPGMYSGMFGQPMFNNQNMPSFDMNNMCLTDVFDPFQFYR